MKSQKNSNKPVKNFQKKKYNNYSPKERNNKIVSSQKPKQKWIPKEQWIQQQQEKKELTDKRNNDITGWFNKEKNITMKEYLNGTFEVDFKNGTIWKSRDGKKTLLLKS